MLYGPSFPHFTKVQRIRSNFYSAVSYRVSALAGRLPASWRLTGWLNNQLYTYFNAAGYFGGGLVASWRRYR